VSRDLTGGTPVVNPTLRPSALTSRRRRSALMTALTWAAAALAVLPMAAILIYLVVGGASAFSPAFFTRMPAPAGAPGGGMANAITGTLILIGIAVLIGVPIGLGAGLFSAERSHTRLAKLVRFVAEVLSGLPSIVLGIFVWEIVVRPAGHFSALAGGIALGLLIIPLVTRATEEMVKLVPTELSEAAMALGFSRWRTSILVVLRTATPGIVTAALVAVARAAGETAPLLFTAFGNGYITADITGAMSAVPLVMYRFAGSGFENWEQIAWAGALVLTLFVLSISLVARFVLLRNKISND